MCGRVVVALDSATLAAIGRARNIRNQASYRQSYNVAPGSHIPGVYRVAKGEKDENKNKQDGKFDLEMMKWGSKNKDNIPFVNARSETVAMYFKTWKRCVIIVQGYYEWKEQKSQSNFITTQPFYIHDKNRDYLLLAGIYRENIDSEEEFDKEVLIITMSSNKELEEIHSRMPVLLDHNLMNEYLENDIPFDKLFIKASKFEDIQINFYPVGDLVNKLHNYGKDNILHRDEITYDKNKNLKLTNFLKKRTDDKKADKDKIKENQKQKLQSTPDKIHDTTENNTIEVKNDTPTGEKGKSLETINKIETKNSKIKVTSTGKRKTSISPDPTSSKFKKRITQKSLAKEPLKYNNNILTDFLKKSDKK